MERLILDSGVLIAAERGRVRVPDDDVAIASITASELLVGVARADDHHRELRSRSVEEVLRTFEVLPFDIGAARQHALLMAWTQASGSPRGAHDLIIAATASATGRTVLTTDQRGFGDLPGVTVRVLTSN